MTDTTPNLGLPELIAAQAQKHVTVNEALRAIDALVQLAVLDRGLMAAPGSPEEGQRWIVASGASGDWSGKDGQVAAWLDGGWSFFMPQVGWLAYVVDEGGLVTWDGSAWVDAITNITTLNNLALLGVGTTADATNPFSAKLNNVLWAAKALSEGGDGNLRWKMSKEAAGDTLSMLFQTAYSGRAELGLTGDDDFHLKVSSDGTTWKDAFGIDRATGGVRFLAHTTDVASAATCDIGAAPSLKVRITGSTTITSFGSAIHAIKLVRFAGALTLTHNATSLALPGGANIVTAADDFCVAVSDASGNWRVYDYARANGVPINAPVATTDNRAARFDGAAGNLQGSNVTIGDDGKVMAPAGLLSCTLTVADDGVATVAQPSGTSSMILEIVTLALPAAGRPNGLFHARCAATPSCSALMFITTANITLTTGALSGTTGTDGYVTLSAHTDGNLYIENRTGASRTFAVRIGASV